MFLPMPYSPRIPLYHKPIYKNNKFVCSPKNVYFHLTLDLLNAPVSQCLGLHLQKAFRCIVQCNLNATVTL